MRRSGVIFLTLLLVLGAACNRRPAGAKEPRFPDEQGVVTEVDLSNIELNGSRKFEISPDVQSFSTYNETVIPLLTWKGKYVHIGLRNKKAIWIAGIGPLDTSLTPPRIFYTNGVFLEKRGSNAIFKDGTVLGLASGVETPVFGTIVKATIDPDKRLVIDLFWEEKQNAGSSP